VSPIAPYTLVLDAMDRVLASMPPDDTAAALRLLKVLEECRQMSPTEAEAWRRRRRRARPAKVVVEGAGLGLREAQVRRVLKSLDTN
jgi:hypothetical protein